MTFFKKAEVQNLQKKYGSNKSIGIVALEMIAKGEIIFKCDANKCMYYPLYGPQDNYTKEQLNNLLEQHPDSRDFIYAYVCMADENVYHVPKSFLSKVVTEECALFNHSCDPNVGYDDDLGVAHVALRDIDAGEELTIHYGYFENENSLHNGIECKCGSPKCSKILYFDFYKNSEFQGQYYKHCCGYIKSKIRSLRPDIEN